MKETFADILGLSGVKGIVLVSPEGKILFKVFNAEPEREPDDLNWGLVMHSLADIREADIVCEKLRIYFRMTPVGHLFILMDRFGSMAMVRLHCDLLLPVLKQTLKSTSRKGFFSWRK